MIYFILIAFMAVASAYAGGSLPGSGWLNKKGEKDGKMPFDMTWLPELLFAIPFGVLFGMILNLFDAATWLIVVAGVVVTAWAYIWMQTGHGVVLGFGKPRAPTADPNRRQTLSPVVDWLADRLKITKTQGDAVNSPTVAYCWLFMGVKGFLIGLFAGGVPLAVMWPASYQAGAWLRGRVSFNAHLVSELLAGAGAGVAIAIAWEFAKWAF